jgi:hypothetical protein
MTIRFGAAGSAALDRVAVGRGIVLFGASTSLLCLCHGLPRWIMRGSGIIVVHGSGRRLKEVERLAVCGGPISRHFYL